jgi:hypothetical protein
MAPISDERIYEQCCLEFRSINGFFWQIPLIMMTLNGGLWYSVASLTLDVSAQRWILWFAAGANLVMIAGLWRLRNIMGGLLDRIRTFEGVGTKKGPRRLVQTLFSLLLGAAALGALLASCDPARHFPATVSHAKAECRDAGKK